MHCSNESWQCFSAVVVVVTMEMNAKVLQCAVLYLKAVTIVSRHYSTLSVSPHSAIFCWLCIALVAEKSPFYVVVHTMVATTTNFCKKKHL